MAAQCNKTCQVCFANEATYFCACTTPSSLLCLGCSGVHSDPIFHQTFPIAALGRNLEEYEPKYKALLKAAAELRKNVERIDQCCNEFDDITKTCAKYLADYRRDWLQHMQTEKEVLSAAIEAAVLETFTCLSQHLEPSSPLAWALWTLHPEEMEVVSCSVSRPDLQALSRTCTSYCSQLQALCERGQAAAEAMHDFPRAVQPSQVSTEPFLHVIPFNEVTFTYFASSAASNSTLLLRNIHSSRISFKMLCTVPQAYVVNPNMGVLEPSQALTVVIKLMTRHAADIGKHKFSIQYKETSSDPNDQSAIKALWADNNLKVVQKVILKVVAIVVPEPPLSASISPSLPA